MALFTPRWLQHDHSLRLATRLLPGKCYPWKCYLLIYTACSSLLWDGCGNNPRERFTAVVQDSVWIDFKLWFLWKIFVEKFGRIIIETVILGGWSLCNFIIASFIQGCLLVHIDFSISFFFHWPFFSSRDLVFISTFMLLCLECLWKFIYIYIYIYIILKKKFPFLVAPFYITIGDIDGACVHFLSLLRSYLINRGQERLQV